MTRKLNRPKALQAPVPVSPVVEDEPGVIFVPRVFHARARLVEQMRLEELERKRAYYRVVEWWNQWQSVWRRIGAEVAAIRHYKVIDPADCDYEYNTDSACGLFRLGRTWDTEEGRHKFETEIYRVTCRRCLNALMAWADTAQAQWQRLEECNEENGKW